MSGSVLPSTLKVISNPIRRAIIQLLSEGKVPYIELLTSIGLDLERHRGWFNYHLEVLMEEGVIAKEADQYILTDLGKNTASLLDIIDRESHKLFREEVIQLEKDAITEKSIDRSPEITSEETQFGKVRLLEEHDIPDVLEVLFTVDFYRKYPDRMKNHLTRLAKRGHDKYENNLVAEREGKAVGRAVVDTSYPPYAELAGLLVHPEYRGKGVGTDLVEGCIALARKHNCNIMYVMTWKNTPSNQKLYGKYGISSHKLYKRFGFHPAILQGFTDSEAEICLFRLSDTPCYQNFMNNHPLAVLSISEGKIDFHGKQVYEMKWKDHQTEDFLAFYLKGKRHESMPRIVGTATQEGSSGFDAWTEEIRPDITSGRYGKLGINLQNTGKETTKAQVDLVLPEGVTINGEHKKTIYSELDKEANWEFRLEVKPDFEVPVLSFWTVLVTCQVQVGNFPYAFPMSAGFELDRPPTKRKRGSS